jgi:hypothetical protein
VSGIVDIRLRAGAVEALTAVRDLWRTMKLAPA